MKNEKTITEWREKEYIPAMRDYGLGEGGVVVDYGCSIGNYTIPLAQLVSDSGKVYAADIDNTVFDTVMTRAEEFDLHNVICIAPKKGYVLPLNDAEADAFIIYDLIHYLKSDGILPDVVSECKRVLKAGGIFSVLPFHLSANSVKDIWNLIEDNGFAFIGTAKGVGLHFEMQRFYGNSSKDISSYERGDISFFRKVYGIM